MVELRGKDEAGQTGQWVVETREEFVALLTGADCDRG